MEILADPISTSCMKRMMECCRGSGHGREDGDDDDLEVEDGLELRLELSQH